MNVIIFGKKIWKGLTDRSKVGMDILKKVEKLN